MSRSFPTVFPLELLVSGSTFKSSVHFELTLVNGVRVQFQTFPCGYSIFPTPLIEDSILSHLDTLGVLVKDELTVYAWVYVWALCSSGQYILFYANIILFWWLQLCNIAWNQETWCLQLCFSFSRFPWLFELFCGFIWILGSWEKKRSFLLL